MRQESAKHGLLTITFVTATALISAVTGPLVSYVVAQRQIRASVAGNHRHSHNANLMVNTNADQIIIARAGPHARGELPPIGYESSGLESASIRKAVCNILEGGERAFQERARRLRVHLER